MFPVDPCCPHCRWPLRCCGTFDADGREERERPGWGLWFLADLLVQVVALVAVGALASLLSIVMPYAVAVGLATLVAVVALALFLWRPWQASNRQAHAERGHWVCDRCHAHFKGFELREVAPPLPDRSAGLSR